MTPYYVELAVRKVKEAGGSMTFDEYDAAMKDEGYVAPFNWLVGWGLSDAERSKNNDIQCAWAACDAGLLVQTDNGYKIVSEEMA